MKPLHLLTLTALLALADVAQAQGTAFTYQGRLNDAAGPATGTYDFQFTVRDALTGGSPVGVNPLAATVAVSNGLFTVALDFGAGVFTGQPRWLEIGVATNGGGSFATLTPRQRITSTPYAMQADNAVTASAANSVSAANISGTLTTAQLPANLLTNNQAGVTLGGAWSGNGGGLTNLTAGSIVAGTLADTRLSGNVALRNGNNGFTGTNALTDIDLHLRGSADANHGVGWYGSGKPFANFSPDGPMLFGYSAGGLGTTINTQALALTWNAAGNVGIGTANPSARLSVYGNATVASNLTVVGAVTAASFTGNGSALTALNAASLNTGTVPLAQLPALLVTNGESAVTLAGTFSGDGTGLVNVDLHNLNTEGAFVYTTNYVFSIASSPAVGNGPISVVAADINGDAKPDLICANSGGNSLSVLTNNGSGGFALAATLAVGTTPFSVVAAAVNGDGKVDLVTANQGNNTLSVLTNNGAGGFVLGSSPAVGSQPASVVAADVNGDGKVDLISANFGNNTLSVLTNNGSGLFTLASSPAVGVNPRAVAAADVNGDGKVDLISANANGNNLSVLTNTGTGSFVVASSPGPLNHPFALIAAEINGDGKADLVSANNDGTLAVLTNNGTGGFALASSPAVGASTWAVVAADMNGDGKLDLVSANSGDNTLTVLLNSGGGAFLSAASPAVGASPHSVAAVDVNGDGRGDLVSANFNANTLSVLPSTPNYSSFLNAANLTGVLDPSHIPGLDASKIVSGTLSDGQLSANVAFRNLNNNFLANNSFSGSNSFLGFSGFFGASAHNDVDLYLRGAADNHHGLGFYGNAGFPTSYSKTFAGFSPDGPVLYGYSGGGLGTTVGSQTLALTWNSAGNVGIGTSSPTNKLHVLGGATFSSGNAGANQNVVWVPGSASWSFTSDRHAKDRIAPVDAQAVLAKVARVPIQEWSYIGYEQRHIGPMAQDFHAQFPLNADNKTLNDADLHGVALAAIQGLNEKLEVGRQKSEVKIQQLEAENAGLKARLEKLEQVLHAMHGGAR